MIFLTINVYMEMIVHTLPLPFHLFHGRLDIDSGAWLHLCPKP